MAPDRKRFSSYRKYCGKFRQILGANTLQKIKASISYGTEKNPQPGVNVTLPEKISQPTYYISDLVLNECRGEISLDSKESQSAILKVSSSLPSV